MTLHIDGIEILPGTEYFIECLRWIGMGGHDLSLVFDGIAVWVEMIAVKIEES